MAHHNNNDNMDRWDLTAYEVDRMPQEVITDHGARMALHPECLRDEFQCPICLKLQSNTVTVMGCLHRFCRECIISALSKNNKECPVCRTKLPNKRHLRPDPNFDMLISRIFPLREDEFDEIESGTTPSGPAARIRTRQDSRRLRSLRFARDASPELDPLARSPEMNSVDEENELEIIFKPLDLTPTSEDGSDLDPWFNQTRYIKISPTATISHVIKYLCLRYQTDNGMDVPPDDSLITLCVAKGPGQYMPLLTINNANNGQSNGQRSGQQSTNSQQPDSTSKTLLEVKQEHFKKTDKPVEFHYAYNINYCSATDTGPQLI